MDNVREKLVELLMQVSDNMCDDCGREPVGCAVVAIADYLFANGVTVQEWIPVSEPPETNGCYLVAGNIRWDGNPMTREAYWNGEDWLSCDGKFYITRRITHWMRSPQPPKGG